MKTVLRPHFRFLALVTFFALVVGVAWFKNLSHGYFSYDDFEVLSSVRAMSVSKWFFLPHGDHTIPLFRAELALLKYWFGVNAWAYNFALFWVFTLIPGVTAFWLWKSGLSWRVAACFAAFFVFYSDWNALLSGYYILSVYLQIILFTVAGLYFLDDWLDNKRKIALFFMGLCVLASLTVEIGGVVCLPILGLRILTRRWSWSAVLSLGLMGSLFAGYLYIVFVKLHPHQFLSMSTIAGDVKTTHTLGDRLADLYFLITHGHLFALPGITWMIKKGWGGTRLLEFGTFFTFLALILISLLKAPRTERRMILFCALAYTAASIMIAIGRPGGVQLKHAAIPFFWFCLLIALIFDQAARSLPPKLMRAVEIGVLLVFILPFFLGSSKRLYREEAIQRSLAKKQAVADMQNNLVPALLRLHLRRDLRIPSLSGLNLDALYGSPIYQYDFSQYLDFFPFDKKGGRAVHLFRGVGMSAWTTSEVQPVSNLRRAVDPEFLNALKVDPVLRKFYLAPVFLKSARSDKAATCFEVQFDDDFGPADPAAFFLGDATDHPDLTQVMRYSLSEKISNLQISPCDAHFALKSANVD